MPTEPPKLLTNTNPNKMELLKCTKCKEEAYSYKELVRGKCGRCGGRLEEENGFEDTEAEFGYFNNGK